MERVVLVANAKAGSAESTALTAARAVLERAFAVDLRQTADPAELDELVSDLDGRLLVVAGGDGSLHATINALHRAQALESTVVGLIPLGTGNDLARSAEIPLDPEAAAHTVLSCRPQPQDLLEGPDGVLAVNAVHLGIGAEAVRAGATFKDWVGPAGYPMGAVLAGLRRPGWDLQVLVDDVPMVHDGRLLMVGISLGRSIGGGAPLAPDAEVDDGAVDVTVASTTGPVARVQFATRLRRGRHRELPGVTTTRGRVIAVQGQAVRANVDGEVTEPRTAWTWRARRHAWSLIRPGR